MRIGCLQFAPQVADVDNNLNRADAVLNKADPEDLDLLVLPELAFSGYNFKSLEHISPFLEVCGSGISALWARTTALKYNCHVAVGYPEKVDPTTSWPTDPEYYNSLIVVNEDGETVANYRKSHLYYTDETWALEGDEGFFEGYIEGLGDTSMGICMDLNPYKFEAPWSSFEFAFHVLECQSNLAIVSMAWMTREDSRTFSRLPNEPDMDTLTYWATRLEPLIRVEGEREVIIIFCNRTGMEDNVVYAGTSAVVGILDGEVRVYGVLGRGEKELLVIDTDNPPYAKLVQRQGDGDSVAQGELQTSDISITPYSARATQSKRKSRESKQGGTTDASQSSPANTSSVGMSFEDTTTLQNRRSRAQPQLQVSTDSVRQTANANSATSARSMDSNIPTPSAPSPTPNGTRPKLVIPQTPHSAVRQGLSPMPMSAQSIHSVKSNISTRSRPPEDSTPYPHSGVPPSGHPRSRTMYDGNTSIAQRAFSPTTPFDNGSPVAYRTGSDVASQVSRGTVSTARHRPPRRAFQEWPVIKPRAAENRDVMPASQKMAAWLAKESGGTYSEPFSEDFRPQEDSRALGHPSSSKSRDTSRTGHHERSNSSLAQQDNAEFEQLVGSIQRRTDSGSRTRGQAGQGSLPSRPESRKGLDRGLSRSARKATPIVVGVTDKAVARDLARPSTGGLPGESHKARRSTSRTGTHARSASISEDAHMRATNTLINYTAEPEQPGSRAVSRGRRPGPHSSSVSHIEIGIGFDALRDFKEKRAPTSRHADSPSTTSRSGNPSHETSRHRSGTGTSSRQASRAAQHDDEVTFCPNCSHEFRAPSKTPSRHAQSSLSNYQSSPRQGVPMSQNALDLINQMNSRSASMDSRSSVSDSFATSEIDSFGTRGTASALEISPSTPEYGDMKTPKALIFFHDTDEVAEERKPIAPNTDEKTLSSSSYLKQVVL